MTAPNAAPHPPAAQHGGLRLDIRQALPMPLQGQLTCQPGELLALVGPSGAGKTSMLRVLAGLMRPEHGTISVAGEIWCDTARGIHLSPRQRHVGLVFQQYALMPHLSACDNVALSLLHLPRAQRRAQALEWLRHVRLSDDLALQRPARLSGGQQQRVAMARALARAPRLLLLDEPFSAVDQLTRQSLYTLLADLRRELFIPIVLVTHDLHEARLLADTLAIMDHGHVLQQGRPVEIHQSPRNARVAQLTGIRNQWAGLWEGPGAVPGQGLLRWVGDGQLAADAPLLVVRDKRKLPAGQAVRWVIPGEGIALSARVPQGTNEFAARVEDARHLGEITLASLVLTQPPHARLQLTLSGPQHRGLCVGDQLTVAFDTSLIHVMPLR